MIHSLPFATWTCSRPHFPNIAGQSPVVIWIPFANKDLGGGWRQPPQIWTWTWKCAVISELWWRWCLGGRSRCPGTVAEGTSVSEDVKQRLRSNLSACPEEIHAEGLGCRWYVCVRARVCALGRGCMYWPNDKCEENVQKMHRIIKMYKLAQKMRVKVQL